MIISIIIFKFYFVCVYVHMWIYAHEFSCLESSENCIGSQGAGVRYCYEPPDVSSGNQIWVLYIYGIKIWSGIFSTHRQSDWQKTDWLTCITFYLPWWFSTDPPYSSWPATTSVCVSFSEFTVSHPLLLIWSFFQRSPSPGFACGRNSSSQFHCCFYCRIFPDF